MCRTGMANIAYHRSLNRVNWKNLLTLRYDLKEKNDMVIVMVTINVTKSSPPLTNNTLALKSVKSSAVFNKKATRNN